MSSSSTWRISSRKPPKCGATKKSQCTLVGAPMAPLAMKPVDAPHIGDVAAVLDDGMDAAGAGGGVDDRSSVVARVGERLFGEQVAAVTEGGKRDVAPCFRDDDVEHHVGGRVLQHQTQVGADHGRVQAEFAGARRGAPFVEVDEARDRQAVDLGGGLEPCLAHGSASDKDGIHHPDAPPRPCSRVGGAMGIGRRFPSTFTVGWKPVP